MPLSIYSFFFFYCSFTLLLLLLLLPSPPPPGLLLLSKVVTLWRKWQEWTETQEEKMCERKTVWRKNEEKTQETRRAKERITWRTKTMCDCFALSYSASPLLLSSSSSSSHLVFLLSCFLTIHVNHSLTDSSDFHLYSQGEEVHPLLTWSTVTRKHKTMNRKCNSISSSSSGGNGQAE